MSTDVIQTEKPGKTDPRGKLRNSRVGVREQHTQKKTNTELKPTNQKKKTKTTLSYLSSIEQPCIFSNITFYVLI